MKLYDSPKEELEKFINIVANTCKKIKVLIKYQVFLLINL